MRFYTKIVIVALPFAYALFAPGVEKRNAHRRLQKYYIASKKTGTVQEVTPSHGKYDVAVIGSGIVGLAVARELRARFPQCSVCVIEKESNVAPHQSSHNSGVIHAGIYYKENSLQAQLCVRGLKLMYKYCEENAIPYERIGKLIVATDESEAAKVHELYALAKKNGVEGLELLNADQIKKLEPNVNGVVALHSPNTGITDFGEVARSLLKNLQKQSDGKFALLRRFHVEAMAEKPDGGIAILGRELSQHGPDKVVEAKSVVTCCGLHMDTVGRIAGGSRTPTVIPFRGRYYQMKSGKESIVKRNIYPIPTAGGIQTGVHFTPTVSVDNGKQMLIGPGAALAFHREGYNWYRISLRDLMRTATCKNAWTFLMVNTKTALLQLYQDASHGAFLDEARKLVPTLKGEDVVPSFCGVMGQVFADNGMAMPDYVFEATAPPPLVLATADRPKRHGLPVLNVRNAPSPAATSSLAIAEEVVRRAEAQFGLK